MDITINRERFLGDMQAQAQFGATAAGGLSRPALSPPNIEVRNWFADRARAAGLAVHQDGAANLSAVLHSGDPNAKTLMIGSHLDSVLDGGRFDGPLGVITALEVLRTINDHDLSLPFHLEAISFTDEEGNLLGLTGSRAVAGLLDAAGLQNPRGGRDTLLAGMERVGITDESMLGAARDPETIAGYLEVHIEQGARLKDAGLKIGVVTALVGIRMMWLHFTGEAAHAGTMPVPDRKDAFWGAVRFTERARQAVIDHFLPGVVNVGRIEIAPGAFNIVPGNVSVGVEYRHGTDGDMNAMRDAFVEIAERAANEFGLTLAVEHMEAIAPATMNEVFMKHIESAADDLQLPHTRLMSFAGHDPQSMAQIVPTAMFFVPSENGISHNPAEFTRDDDCVHAANVMLRTVLHLAETYER